MRQFLLLLALFFPTVAYGASPTDFKELVAASLNIINLLIPFLFGLSFLVFLWGILNAWILGGGDETKIEKGRQLALAGMLGLVVMSGVWGIVALIQSSIF